MLVYCATTNAGKLREFRAAAKEAFTVEPLPNLRSIEAPEETGATFEENAILKARYYGAFTGELLFAEDSGLEVDALGGAPGVYSARFSGPGATDDANNAALITALQEKPNRTARYVCVIALVRGTEVLSTFRGTVEGQITHEPRGSGGFGYDPFFFYPPFDATFGEVSTERKQTVSHRGAAFRQMKAYLLCMAR